MAQPWFKFYGGKYLSDSKLAGLTTAERCCWIALLCLASQSEDSIIRFLTTDGLLRLAGISYNATADYSEWEACQKVLKKFENLGLIEMLENESIIITNFQKRQDAYLTDTEKKRNYREKHIKVDNVHPAQVDKSTPKREDKIRLDKIRLVATTPELKKSFFENPIMADIQKTYPDRNYEFQFNLMIDWWQTNKKKLPQNISAFSNWLVKTQPDPKLQAERRTRIEKEAQDKKQAEIDATPQASPESLNKLREQVKAVIEKKSIR